MTSVSRWPLWLQLEVIQARVSTLDIQAWIRKTKSPVVRIECAPGMNNDDLAQLITFIRNSGSVSRPSPPFNLPPHILVVRDCAMGYHGPALEGISLRAHGQGPPLCIM